MESDIDRSIVSTVDAHNIKIDLITLAGSFAFPTSKPIVEAYSLNPRPDDFELIWQEWFCGIDGQPSVWQMNKHHPKWRQNWPSKKRKHYAFYKTLVDYALKRIQTAPPGVETQEQKRWYGINAVSTEVLNHGSLNKFYLSLRKTFP